MVVVIVQKIVHQLKLEIMTRFRVHFISDSGIKQMIVLCRCESDASEIVRRRGNVVVQVEHL